MRNRTELPIPQRVISRRERYISYTHYKQNAWFHGWYARICFIPEVTWVCPASVYAPHPIIIPILTTPKTNNNKNFRDKKIVDKEKTWEGRKRRSLKMWWRRGEKRSHDNFSRNAFVWFGVRNGHIQILWILGDNWDEMSGSHLIL